MPTSVKLHSLRAHPNGARGLSLVELMVGITVGLFIVAAATTLVASQLTDNRRLLTETQLQQDLRASLDIISRQLRRAAAVDDAATQAGLATRLGGVVGGSPSTFTSVTPGSTSADNIRFVFMLNVGEQGPFVYKLENNVIKNATGAGGFQELTDANTMKVTRLDFQTRIKPSDTLPCPKLCRNPPTGTAADTSCWPKLVIRSVVVVIEAEAKNDPAVRRSISSEVRLRNDFVAFNDPANPSQVCPL